MQAKRKTTAAAALAICLGALIALPTQAGQQAFDPDRPVMKPAEKVDWVKVNEAIKFGHGFGDRSKGAHGTFGTFPAKFITPLHTHTNAYHAVVVQGTMTNPMGPNGEKNPAQMDAGSYWYVPAGAPHATACVSETPCKFYMHGTEFFDFHVAK